MHTEIPDTLLAPWAEPIPLSTPRAAAPAPANQDAANPDAVIQDKESQQLARDMLHRRKRRVALLAVLVVAVAVPAIVLALSARLKPGHRP